MPPERRLKIISTETPKTLEKKRSDRAVDEKNNINIPTINNEIIVRELLELSEKLADETAKNTLEQTINKSAFWGTDYGDAHEAAKLKIEKLATEVMPVFTAQLKKLKIILPTFDTAPYEELLQTASDKVNQALENNQTPNSENQEKQLKEMVLPQELLHIIETKLKEELNREAGKYFEPLISRARADVLSYIIYHTNTNNVGVEETQRMLLDRSQRKIDVKFDYSFAGPNEGAGGKYEQGKISINLDHLNTNLNSTEEKDEAALLHVITHEIIHHLSEQNAGDQQGLRGQNLIEKPDNVRSTSDPDVLLNEATTEMLTLEIMSKYFSGKETPGTTILKKGKEQVVGYEWQIKQLKQLREQNTAKTKEMMNVLYDGMLRGTSDNVKAYFKQNPEMYTAMQKICTEDEPKNTSGIAA